MSHDGIKLVESKFKELLNKVNRYIPEGTDLISRAFEFASEKHASQRRASGEPYIIHPLEVATILADIKVDADTVAAALLHDVLEDTDATYEDLERLFNPTVAKLVFGVTKLTSLSKITRESLSGIERGENLIRKELQIVNLRKLLVRTADDIRVLVLKLADRLHNMRTISALPEEKRKRISLETLRIYAPLSHRLGMWVFKRDLEDLSFKELYPREYEMLKEKVEAKLKEAEPLLESFKQRLEELLKDLKPKITYRRKGLYSLFDKMQRKGVSLDDVYDLLAFRVLVKTIPECYTALGLIHQEWVPLPNRIKDYIAKPKPNGYQSIHTTVYTSVGFPVEIQIRTYDMHLEAEWGIAAHWAYKDEGLGEKLPSEKRLKKYKEKFNELLNSLDEALREGEFESFQEELSRSVIVFTPKGECIELPKGSTPVDFAYRIHTEVGNRCVGAKVNGRLVSLRYELEDGDIVEVLTSKSAKPSLDWLNFVRTSHAKSKIKGFFKKVKGEEYVRRAREILEREASGFLNLKEVDLDELIEEVYNRYYRRSFAEKEDMLINIGFGDLKPQGVIDKLRLIAKEKGLLKEREEKRSGSTKLELKSSVSTKGLLVRLAKCCKPIKGDDIVGIITIGKGISVHRKDCNNLKHLLKNKPELKERLIELSWDELLITKSVVRIMIKAIDRKGLLRDIMDIISGEGINVTSVKGRAKNSTATLEMDLELSSSDTLRRLVAVLKSKVPEIISISRV